MKYITLVIFGFLLLSCKSETKKIDIKPLTANEIIDKSIEVSGGSKFKNSSLKFDFRGVYYQALRKNHEFLLVRINVKDDDSIFDMLSNVGFERFVNDKFIALEDSIANKYKASVNSVHYFSVLPFGLNDTAVNKKLLGEETLKAKDYYKIEVTFKPEGGGEDYEDVFLYWVNKKTFKPDYIAYSYNEDDDKGMRFREAFNERYIKGLRFVDYNNYKSEDETIELADLGNAYEANKLKLLSKIELENLTVDLIN